MIDVIAIVNRTNEGVATMDERAAMTCCVLRWRVVVVTGRRESVSLMILVNCASINGGEESLRTTEWL